MTIPMQQATVAARQEIRATPFGFVSKGANERVALESIWRHRMHESCNGFFGRPIAEQNKSLHAFVTDAGLQGISRSQALRFVREMQYIHRITNAEAVSKGQAPGLIFISNTPKDPLQKSLNHGNKGTIGCVLHGGTFIISSQISTVEEASRTQDFQPVFYALNNNASHGHTLPPYVFINTGYNFASNNHSSLSAALLSIARRDKLRSDALSKGHHFLGNKWLFPTASGNVPVHILAIVHDIMGRDVFIVERTPRSKSIYMVSPEQWCRENGLQAEDADGIRESFISTHLQNLASHKDDKYYPYSMELDSGCGSIRCTDSRIPQNLATNSERLIGAIPSEAEFVRRVSDPRLEQLEILIHTGCGYINSAIGIHKMFGEVNVLSEGKKVLRKRISSAVDSILKGRTFGMNIQAFLNDLGGISPGSAKTYQDFFGNTDGSIRSIFGHMLERGLFEISDSGLVEMPSARKIGHAILDSGAQIPEGLEPFLIHEEIAARLQDNVISWQEKHGEGIREARGGLDIPARVIMVGLDTARKWHMPEELSLELQGRHDAVLQNEFIPAEVIAKELPTKH